MVGGRECGGEGGGGGRCDGTKKYVRADSETKDSIRISALRYFHIRWVFLQQNARSARQSLTMD